MDFFRGIRACLRYREAFWFTGTTLYNLVTRSESGCCALEPYFSLNGRVQSTSIILAKTYKVSSSLSKFFGHYAFILLQRKIGFEAIVTMRLNRFLKVPWWCILHQSKYAINLSPSWFTREIIFEKAWVQDLKAVQTCVRWQQKLQFHWRGGSCW